MPLTYEQIVEPITGPGGPFEIVVETVGNRAMKNFKNRERSIREKLVTAAGRGDATAIVYGQRRIGYGEFAKLSFGVAQALTRDHGLVKGDRVLFPHCRAPRLCAALHRTRRARRPASRWPGFRRVRSTSSDRRAR